MQKLTGRSGSRKASGTTQTSRVVSPMQHLRGSMPPHPQRPAFLPPTPQESGYDNDTIARVSEPGDDKQGWTGKGIGA